MDTKPWEPRFTRPTDHKTAKMGTSLAEYLLLKDLAQ